ncbi:hypothetical protein [Myxococcus sp. AB036A]|uniref:hypothetical protein n=1 Tax=Myxococcus sp. AB036A TaxID=2562793 RepID=UPI001E3C5EED|nr:hypothetical protein [Myxococcus sp. AB036A]
MATALNTTSGQLLAENNGDVEAALQQLTAITEPLAQLSEGGSSVKSGIETIKAALASGTPEPLLELSKSDGKLGAALAGVGAAYGLASATNDAIRGEWGDFIKALASSGRSGAEAAAFAMRTLGESGRIAAQTGEAAAAFLSRLAPAFGVVANSVVVADHFIEALRARLPCGEGLHQQGFDEGAAVVQPGGVNGTRPPGSAHGKDARLTSHL